METSSSPRNPPSARHGTTKSPTLALHIAAFGELCSHWPSGVRVGTDLVVGTETELGVGGVETELAVLGGGVCGVGTELAVHVELGGDGVEPELGGGVCGAGTDLAVHIALGLTCTVACTGPLSLGEEVQSRIHFFLGL